MILFEHLKNLLFPPVCVHCQAAMNSGEALLCQPCLIQLEPLDPAIRCLRCYGTGALDGYKTCSNCRRSPPIWRRTAAAFPYEGPAATLVKRLKYGGQVWLAASVAPWLVFLLDQLDWKTPDCIVPVPMPPIRSFYRGVNHAHAIAIELGKLLNRPVVTALTRQEGCSPRATLSRERRIATPAVGCSLRPLKRQRIEDQDVLLVDDVSTTGATLNHCAESLLGAHPRDLSALTFCRTGD